MATRREKGIIAKVLVIGDVAVGKTSIVKRYVHKTFDANHYATLWIAFELKKVRVENTPLNIQMWDIAGQDRFIGLAPTYYRDAVAALVVFDITLKSTLHNAKKWKQDVDDKVFLKNGDNIPVVLFANKWDLIQENEELRCVTDSELDQFCRDNHFIGWFTTSAKTGLNIKKAMNLVITKIMKNKAKMEASQGEDEGVTNDSNNDDCGRITADDLENKIRNDTNQYNSNTRQSGSNSNETKKSGCC